MGDSTRLDVEIFAENRARGMANETAAYTLPAAIIYFVFLKLIAGNTASGHANASIGLYLLVAFILALLIFSFRMKLISIRGSNELIIVNMWNSHRVKWDQISEFSVGNYLILPKIGPKIPIVKVIYNDGSAHMKKSVPIIASFSGGKPSRMLDELGMIAVQKSIQCDLSKMIR